jgi:cGMP-dependent protein kinase 1
MNCDKYFKFKLVYKSMGNCYNSKRKQINVSLDIKSTHIPQTLITKTQENHLESNEKRRKTTKKTQNNQEYRNSEDLDAPTAQVCLKPKTKKDRIEIKKALLKHFLFSSLPEENLESLIENMKFYTLGAKEVIFCQGQPGFNFFVLMDGIVEIIVNGVFKGYISHGNGFGELALIHDSGRTATIQTVTSVSLWGIDRSIFRGALKTLSEIKFEENFKFITSIPFFSKLSMPQLESLVSVLVNQAYKDGQQIIIEGDPGNLFYIIQEGSVQCSFNQKVIRVLHEQEYFGEQALIYNTFRTATVTAIGKVKVLSIGRDILVSILGDSLQKIVYRNSLKITFERCEVLQKLSQFQINKLIDCINVFSYKNNQIVIKKGKKTNKKIWFVLRGRLESKGTLINVFENIGGKFIYSNIEDTFDSDYTVCIDADIGVLKKTTLEEVTGNTLFNVIKQNKIVQVLKKIQIFTMLSENKLESLASMLKIQRFNDNEIIIRQDDQSDSIYIVKKGEVNVVKDNNILRVISKGDYFGEKSIILNENRTASVVSKGKSKLWGINRDDFMSIIDQSIEKLLIKKISLQDDLISLSDLIILKKIGQGAFSEVFLCMKSQTKMAYAIKGISKTNILKHSLQQSLVLERKILLEIDHPFIVKLIKTFKDDNHVYFLQEYVNGVNLYEVLRVLNLLNSNDCRFYTACIVSIMEYLHQRSIIYRDLKPENLIVDENGYLKLIDFGTSKIINSRTYTVVGTPQYMAPEIILGKGYSFSVDLWSLGVMIFEFVCGVVPFGEDEEEPIAVYKEIIEGNIIYPRFIKQNCREKVIIEQLLRTNPAIRGTAEILKQHKWLAGIDWDDLLLKKLKPPYIPQLEDISDYLQDVPAQSSPEFLVAAQESVQEKISSPGAKLFNADWDFEF